MFAALLNAQKVFLLRNSLLSRYSCIPYRVVSCGSLCSLAALLSLGVKTHWLVLSARRHTASNLLAIIKHQVRQGFICEIEKI